MGWLYTTRADGKTAREFLDQEFQSSKPDGSSFTILKSAMVGRVYYAACRRTFPTDQGKDAIVFALIALTDSRRYKDGYNFGYKDMDETVGPCECDCPVSILNMLSPIPPGEWGYAQDWRDRCYARAKAKREWKTKKPEVGSKIKFAEPISFTNGCKFDTFEVQQYTRRNRTRTVYRGPDGWLYSISKIGQRKFEVIQ